MDVLTKWQTLNHIALRLVIVSPEGEKFLRESGQSYSLVFSPTSTKPDPLDPECVQLFAYTYVVYVVTSPARLAGRLPL